jgi:Fibronectin type III domain
MRNKATTNFFGPNSNSLPTDVPAAPNDINVTDVFQTSCIVHWKPPKDDGGSPLLHYVVERQDLSVKGGWASVAEVPFGQPCTYKCEDLSPKKEYKFRVKAVNKMGASEPATFGKTILAKDPWGKDMGLSIRMIFKTELFFGKYYFYLPIFLSFVYYLCLVLLI